MRLRVLFGVAASLAASVWGVSSASAAVTPGWECVPTTAGQAVVSGGTGSSPSCATGTTAVLAPTYVSSGVGGKPTAQFASVNVQIVSGAGSTGTVNSLGNMVIGYDEQPGSQTGSHNLVLGKQQSYTSWGSLIGGSSNTDSGHSSAVFGSNNTASGAYATVTGGAASQAASPSSSIQGSYKNRACAP